MACYSLAICLCLKNDKSQRLNADWLIKPYFALRRWLWIDGIAELMVIWRTSVSLSYNSRIIGLFSIYVKSFSLNKPGLKFMEKTYIITWNCGYRIMVVL